MFFKNLIRLCNKNNTTPNAVCIALGLSPAAATKWRAGAIPRETTLNKIADYFDCSVDYLLGRTDAPTVSAGYLLGGEEKTVEYPNRDRIIPSIITLYEQLDEIDKVKAEAFIQGLLSADKYTSAANEKNA